MKTGVDDRQADEGPSKSTTVDAVETLQTSPSSVRSRLSWIDCARGIGIVLVVLGHVNAGLLGAHMAGESAPVLSAVNRFIYTFHMAIFFVAAGLFAPQGAQKPSRQFWADKLGGLLYPYLLWSVIQLSFQQAFSGQTNTVPRENSFLAILYDPPMQFWFLYCLLIAQVLYYVFTKLCGISFVFLVFSVAVSLVLAGFDLSATSVLGRCRDNLPLFAVGVMFSNQLARAGSTRTGVLITIFAVGTAFSALAGYLVTGHPGATGAIFLPLPGTVTVFALSILIADQRITSILAQLGRRSLEIYLAHVLAYAGTRILLLRLGVMSVPFHVIAGTVSGLVGPLLLVQLTQLLDIHCLFRYPRFPTRKDPERRLEPVSG